MFCSAGIRDANEGAEPGAWAPAGARRGDCRAQSGTQQHSGKWKLPEKLTVDQFVKKFTPFYGTRSFIIVFATAHHRFLSWARWIGSTISHPSLRPSLILSSHLRLGLPRGFFPLSRPTKMFCTFLSPMITCFTHLIPLDVIVLKLCVGYKLWSSP